MTLTVSKLCVTRGDKDILHEISCSFTPGQLTAVVGPNGCGKTTLLHHLAGFHRPTAGEVLLDGQVVHRMRGKQRARRIALVEQHPETSWDLTARAVVELGRIPHRGSIRSRPQEDAEIVEQVLELTHTVELAEWPYARLSGGQRQRVQLARALAQQPEILLLDEPTNHLDLHQQLAFLNTVTQLGLTVVAVLHDLDLVAAFAAEMVVLHEGTCVAAGPTAEVLTREQIATVFAVDAQVTATDRRRVLWNRPQ